MKKVNSLMRLERLYQQAEEIQLSQNKPVVIFSDFHLGNGTKRDDHNKNSNLVYHTLKDYYLEKKFHLFLNGDIEELLKFRYQHIYKHWKELYDIFDKFNDNGRLYKLIGNHDPLNYFKLADAHPYKLYSAIKLQYGDYPFFIYHGHQSSMAYNRLGRLIKFFLFYFARPLNIKNFTLAFNDEKKSSVEWDSYQFAHAKKIVSIIGHSHRPLFESLSKKDTIIMKLEQYLRKYRKSKGPEQIEIENKIKELNEKLKKIAPEDFITPLNSLYSSGFVQPCLFNSGCTIGKRGITCLEIHKGKIRLVHWFSFHRNPKYAQKKGCYQPSSLQGTPYYRMVLKEDDLSYIYDCINLLS